MKNHLQTYAIRQALGTGAAVFFAVLLNHYHAYSHEGWLVVAAFLAAQATCGAPFRRALYFFVAVLLVAVCSSFNNMLVMQNRVLDVVIGTLLGISLGQLIFPTKLYPEFSAGMAPLLDALMDYGHVYSRMISTLPMTKAAMMGLNEAKWRIEAALDPRETRYPEWVFKGGFNPGLRPGFRFYLIHLEQMTELFFSMHYLAGRLQDGVLLADLSDDFLNVMQKNNELLSFLKQYFDADKSTNTPTDANYTSDIAKLEEVFTKVVPTDLDLLDITSDHVVLTELVRDVKDIRGLLLQLILALPAAPHESY